MITRALTHLRTHAIAYTALFFAIGGGGVGAAVAATTTSATIHVCANRKTGEMFLDKRCGRTTKALVFNQRGPTGATGATGAPGPAGTPAVVVYGQVGDDGVPGNEQGLTITPQITGVYSVTITASDCNPNVPVVTPVGGDGPTNTGPESGVPIAWVTSTSTAGANFDVEAGDLQNGSFVTTDQGFNIQVQCG